MQCWMFQLRSKYQLLHSCYSIFSITTLLLLNFLNYYTPATQFIQGCICIETKCWMFQLRSKSQLLHSCYSIFSITKLLLLNLYRVVVVLKQSVGCFSWGVNLNYYTPATQFIHGCSCIETKCWMFQLRSKSQLLHSCYSNYNETLTGRQKSTASVTIFYRIHLQCRQ